MPDPFDERLQRVLANVASALHPSRPPDPIAVNLLVDQVHRRRHRQRLVQSGVLLTSAVLALGLFVGAPGPASPSQRVNSLGQDGAAITTTTVYLGATGTSEAPSDQGPTTSTCPASRCGVRTLPPTATPTTTPHATTTAPTVLANTPPTAPTTTTTTTRPPSREMISVTESNSGETINLSLGQSVRFLLSGSSSDRWSAPITSDAGILKAQPSGILPTKGSAVAQYRGAAVGQATVSASQDPTCRNSNPPCGLPSRLFTLTVAVGG